MLLSDELRTLRFYDVQNNKLWEEKFDYERSEKSDDKNPCRSGFAHVKNGPKIIISGGYNVKGKVYINYICLET